MPSFDTKHYEKFLESREKAMSYLHKFYLEEQSAQYHLMMYMRQKKPLSVISQEPPIMTNRVPYPEDIEYP